MGPPRMPSSICGNAFMDSYVETKLFCIRFKWTFISICLWAVWVRNLSNKYIFIARTLDEADKNIKASSLSAYFYFDIVFQKIFFLSLTQ